jgi:Rhodanese-related sulfurtransferase
VLPGVVGTLQAIEAIKLLTGIGETLAGRLLLFDALRMETRQLKLRRNPACLICGENPTITALIDYEEFCNPAQPHDVSPAQLAALGKVVLVDVREPYEWESGAIPGARLIPLGDLPSRLNEIPRDEDVVLYCQTGIRSLRALNLLRDAGFRRVKNLSGGYAKWSQSR